MVDLNEVRICILSWQGNNVTLHLKFQTTPGRPTDVMVDLNEVRHIYLLISVDYYHAGHTRKASRISKAAVDNCGKGVGNFYLS